MRPQNRIGATTSEGGFSMVELLVVIVLIVTLTAIAVFSLTPHKQAYAPDDEALKAVSLFREAYHRALSERQTMSITIDRDSGSITLTDGGTLASGDEVVVNRDSLDKEGVTIGQPSIEGAAVNPPAAPYNYTPANFSSGPWVANFRSDGSVVDALGSPLSATLFFVPTDLSNNGAGLIRAVTLYGPTGSVRMWKYNPEQNEFEAGGR